MTLDPEPILFLQRLIEQVAPGSAFEGLAIRCFRAEAADVPPFCLLENAGELHDRGVPAYLPARVSMTWYGETEDDALLLYRAASNRLHRTGPLGIENVWMWRAFDEFGPEPREDPNTDWPAKSGVIALYMPDVAIASGS